MKTLLGMSIFLIVSSGVILGMNPKDNLPFIKKPIIGALVYGIVGADGNAQKMLGANAQTANDDGEIKNLRMALKKLGEIPIDCFESGEDRLDYVIQLLQRHGAHRGAYLLDKKDKENSLAAQQKAKQLHEHSIRCGDFEHARKMKRNKHHHSLRGVSGAVPSKKN